MTIQEQQILDSLSQAGEAIKASIDMIENGAPDGVPMFFKEKPLSSNELCKIAGVSLMHIHNVKTTAPHALKRSFKKKGTNYFYYSEFKEAEKERKRILKENREQVAPKATPKATESTQDMTMPVL